MADQWVGRRATIGLARETTRGTYRAPQHWLPRTSLTFDDKVNKHLEEESLGVIDDSDATFLTERWGEGDMEAEVRDDSFGLLLYAMLGSLSTAGVGGDAAAYDHTFTLSQTNNHQSLSITLDDPIDTTTFPLVMLDSLTLNVEVGSVATFSATFMSRAGDLATDQTPSFNVENKFRATDLGFKLAAARADLGAASAIPIKSLSVTFSKNLLRSMVLGTVEPDDIFNQQFGLEGSITLDNEDRTYRNYMLNNTYRAMEIKLENQSVTVGNSSNPTLTFTMPRCHFYDWEADKSLNDISTQTISFKGLRDVANSEALIYSAVLRNDQANYT